MQLKRDPNGCDINAGNQSDASKLGNCLLTNQFFSFAAQNPALSQYKAWSFRLILCTGTCTKYREVGFVKLRVQAQNAGQVCGEQDRKTGRQILRLHLYLPHTLTRILVPKGKTQFTTSISTLILRNQKEQTIWKIANIPRNASLLIVITSPWHCH